MFTVLIWIFSSIAISPTDQGDQTGTANSKWHQMNWVYFSGKLPCPCTGMLGYLTMHNLSSSRGLCTLKRWFQITIYQNTNVTLFVYHIQLNILHSVSEIIVISAHKNDFTFLTWNSMHHLSVHSTSFSKQSCKTLWSPTVKVLCPSLVSSTHLFMTDISSVHSSE